MKTYQVTIKYKGDYNSVGYTDEMIYLVDAPNAHIARDKVIRYPEQNGYIDKLNALLDIKVVEDAEQTKPEQGGQVLDLVWKHIENYTKENCSKNYTYNDSVKQMVEDGIKDYAKWEDSLLTKNGHWWSKVEVYLKLKESEGNGEG